MIRFVLALLISFSLLFAVALAQKGVVSARPKDETDPRCQMFISHEVVFTFCLNLRGKPIINVINFKDRDVIIDAEGLTFKTTDGRELTPDLLRIATGIPGDYLYRSYVTIRPVSSFALEPSGLDEELKKLEKMEIRIGSWLYRLDPVRKEVFDVMIDRLAQLNIRSKSLRGDLRELDIPTKGTRERIVEFD